MFFVVLYEIIVSMHSDVNIVATTEIVMDFKGLVAQGAPGDMDGIYNNKP